MSEEPTAEPQPAPDGWGQPITEERQAELDVLAKQQRAWVNQPEQERGESPFKGEHLTGADIFWLAARAVAGPEGDIEATAARLQNEALRYTIDASELHLEEAFLFEAQLEGAVLRGAQLKRAVLGDAHLEGADLNAAQLEGADLSGAQLEGAELSYAHLEGAELSYAHLEGADLRGASFDKNSRLNGAQFNGVKLDQVIFDNTNLTVIKWDTVQRLGDETIAQAEKPLVDELPLDEEEPLAKKVAAFHAAARAYRALATALRTQGLSTEATRFHYRAELMARYELLYDFLARLRSRRFYTAPGAFVRWLVSWLLGTFAGYGDRLGRLFLTYLVTVSVFAGLMFAVAGRPLDVDSIRDVYVLSITSFHGRGLQPPGLPLSDALATLAAVEAFFGLAIEALFIAAFTRRVTGG